MILLQSPLVQTSLVKESSCLFEILEKSILNSYLGKKVYRDEVAGGFFGSKYPFCFLGVFFAST